MKLDRILVGVDGSANSTSALEWAAGLAAAVGAEVVAIHALGLLEDIEGERVPAEPHRDEIRARFESLWCAALERSEVANRRLVHDGPPAIALLTAAIEESVDLIVVGTRGMGDPLERFLGSTSAYVVEHSTTPVVVVPSRAA